jgi:uncharacterized repeat protein (TIGR01451 family)
VKRLLPLFVLACAASLRAATFTVTNTNDSGTGSLRWAIEQANAAPGRDIITGGNLGGTITLASPLPAITDSVSIRLGVIIDGTNAGSADGLVINADDVGIYAVSVANFSRDGIVIHGRGDELDYVTATNNRNGVRIDGSAGAFGVRASSNAANGIWITAASSGNQIGRPEDVCTQLCPSFPGPDEATGNALSGIRVDGDNNRVDSTYVGVRPYGSSLPNAGDGIVVSGAHNTVINCVIANNGGYGARLLQPARFENNDGSCNSAGFVGGALIEPPVLTSVRADPTVTALSGEFHGTRNAAYRIDFLGIPTSCPYDRESRVGSIDVTTDSAGFVTWTILLDHSPVTRMSALASREDIEVSRLSDPFPVLITGETRADLSVRTTGPSTASTGQVVEFVSVVTNTGPAAVQSFRVTIPHTPGTSLVSETRNSKASCYLDGLQTCYIGTLAIGESTTFIERVRVTATGGTLNHLASVTHDFGFGMIDPNPANNSSTVTVPVTFDASNIPAVSPLLLLLLGGVLSLIGLASVRVD